MSGEREALVIRAAIEEYERDPIPHLDYGDLADFIAARLAAIPASDNEGLRLIDTKPGIGALTETIELEIDMHNPVGPRYECDCGDQMDGETYNHHVASMVDYRLTATDGDA